MLSMNDHQQVYSQLLPAEYVLVQILTLVAEANTENMDSSLSLISSAGKFGGCMQYLTYHIVCVIHGLEKKVIQDYFK